MNDVLTGAPARVLDAAERIGRGQIVPDAEADAVVDVLSDSMLGDAGFDGEGLTARGIEIDELIGIVQQMSEHFYD